jgi:hypothetical protein
MLCSLRLHHFSAASTFQYQSAGQSSGLPNNDNAVLRYYTGTRFVSQPLLRASSEAGPLDVLLSVTRLPMMKEPAKTYKEPRGTMGSIPIPDQDDPNTRPAPYAQAHTVRERLLHSIHEASAWSS